jgi:hypothetical protein
MAHSPLVRCERRPTAELSTHERHALLTLAAEVAPRLPPAYLLQRFARYEQVWIARRAERVAGFLLVHELNTPETALVYIGPAFSRGGAYAYAFGALVGERLRAAEPFLIAMEVENASVWRMLARLVPSHLFPRTDATAYTAATLRRLARAALARVPHVIDFDAESMTSAIPVAAASDAGVTRYKVLLVSCDGSLETRASLARELRRGLKSLRAGSASSRGAWESYDG